MQGHSAMGDFNCSHGSLVAQQLWTDCGWVEIQDEMSRRHGLPPFNTCKEASRADQVWISPELARFLIVGWNLLEAPLWIIILTPVCTKTGPRTIVSWQKTNFSWVFRGIERMELGEDHFELSPSLVVEQLPHPQRNPNGPPRTPVAREG